jgi:hypothetical protein
MITGDDPILTLIVFMLTSFVIILARLWLADGQHRISSTGRTIVVSLMVYAILLILSIMILIIYITVKARSPWLP